MTWILRQIQTFDWHFSKVLSGRTLPSRWCRCSRVFVRIGDGWFWLPVLLCVFAARPAREFWSISGQCAGTLALSLFCYLPVKLSVRRLRPFQRVPGGRAEVPPLDRFSFPSGHTMHNLAVGLTVAHYFPSVFWPFLLIPFAWGLFRIYFGVHFLSDILAGGVLGACCFRLGQWAF